MSDRCRPVGSVGVAVAIQNQDEGDALVIDDLEQRRSYAVSFESPIRGFGGAGDWVAVAVVNGALIVANPDALPGVEIAPWPSVDGRVDD